MKILISGEFFLLMLAGALFALAALHFTGDFDAAREARNFFN